MTVSAANQHTRTASGRARAVGECRAVIDICNPRPGASPHAVLDVLARVAVAMLRIIIVTYTGASCRPGSVSARTRSPSASIEVRSVLAPPSVRYTAVVTSDSAQFVVAVRPRSQWRWNVVPWEKRPGTEYLFEVQWDSVRRGPATSGRYVYAVKAQVDHRRRPPRTGSLSDLLNDALLQTIPVKTEYDLDRGRTHESALRVRATDSTVTLTLERSTMLRQLCRVRPESVATTVFLVPVGITYRRSVAVTYR